MIKYITNNLRTHSTRGLLSKPTLFRIVPYTTTRLLNPYVVRSSFHTGIDNRGYLQDKSMSMLKNPKDLKNQSSLLGDINKEKGKKEEKDLIVALSEQLIADTNLNTHKPTMAENELNTMELNTDLNRNGFSDIQSSAIMQVITDVLNDEFYSTYNEKYLRDFEIDKQLHLFNSLQSEVKFIIQNSRDSQFNLQHLQTMKLQRDLTSNLDEINESVIDTLEKDRKLEFNNQKFENTLLYRNINLDLNDCTHKISIKMLAAIKSDIESLRWHTTRSGLVAIVVLVSFILLGVNVSNKKANNAENSVKEVVLRTVDPEEDDRDLKERKDLF